MNRADGMKNTAAVLTAIGKIEFSEVKVPEVKPDEVLVKMEAIGVCGSDVHYFGLQALIKI